MHLDVRDLRNFYYHSALGRSAQRVVREKVLEFWPEARKQNVVGFGFAVPLMRPYLGQARRVIGLMPAPQGVMPWPHQEPNVVVLCEDTLWPLETGMADRLLLLHGLETTEHPAQLLDECYRVLGPGGRALFIVPNRAGLWARADHTPFGHGRPYSAGQLENLLKTHGFEVRRHASALYQPPSGKRFWLRTGKLMERSGHKLPFVMAGGVLMVEAAKQVPAPTRPGLAEAVRRPLRILDGLAQPVPKPSSRVAGPLAEAAASCRQAGDSPPFRGRPRRFPGLPGGP